MCVMSSFWARYCNSQWPLETQTEQMWLRSVKQQFDDLAAVFLQALGVGGDLHAFLHSCDAGGQKLGCPLDLDQA